jgi:hypothetical protein
LYGDVGRRERRDAALHDDQRGELQHLRPREGLNARAPDAPFTLNEDRQRELAMMATPVASQHRRILAATKEQKAGETTTFLP